MIIVKVGADCYLNLDRMNYVEPARRGRLVVHFAVGGGDYGGPSTKTTLAEPEASVPRRWLDARSESAERP